MAKYLDIQLDDDLSFRSEIFAYAEAIKKHKKALFLSSLNLPGEAFYTWKVLLESQLIQRIIIIMS